MNENHKNIAYTFLSGIIHALIDFCCAAIVFSFFGKIPATELLNLVLIYNILAFGLQIPIGLLADKYKHPLVFAIIGCILITFAVSAVGYPPVAIVTAGIGNAFFHIGGGVISLNLGKNKCFLPGLFVGPGALGLFAGGVVGKLPEFSFWMILFLPLIAAVLLYFFARPAVVSTPVKFSLNRKIFTAILLLLLLSVAFRSFVGLTYKVLPDGIFALTLLFISAVSFGKITGGILADKFGMFNVCTVGLLLSVPLMYFNNPYTAVIGIFCFNFTMPVTLTALANIMPDYKGLAFGLTTSALLVGALPVFCCSVSSTPILTALITAFSAIVTAVSLIMYEKSSE